VSREGETDTCLPVPACSFPIDLHPLPPSCPKISPTRRNLFLSFCSFLSASICALRLVAQLCLSLFSFSSSPVSKSSSYTQPLPPINKMIGVFLLVVIGTIGAFCQTTHSNGAFSYQGCFSIDPSCFGNALVFSDGRLTPEACQRACQGHLFAALLPE
jgi:hypothetical protein